MNCDKIKSLIGWFHDGELDPANTTLVAEHLEHCPDCAAELAGLRELDRASRHLAAPTIPSDLWDRISGRLPLSSNGVNKSHNSFFARRRFLLTAGTLAAGIIAGIVVYRSRVPKAPEPNAPGAPNGAGPSDPIQVNLASLAPDDRHLVLVQRICVADGCGARLGADGPPRKVVLKNEPIFLCCDGCAQWARAHPSEALAKLHALEHGDGPGKER
jgi:hypothetical protein